jgi:protein TonB
MATAAPNDYMAPSDHIWLDRAWQRSLGASCFLHGAVLAALLIAWHIEPKPMPVLRPIAVTLIHTDETAPDRAAQEAQAAPEHPAPQQKAATAPPPPATTAAKMPAPPAPPPAKPPRVARTPPKPAPPPAPAATPKPDATITALLSQSLDGRPQNRAAPHDAAIALRSSAKLSDDYMLRLQAWIARQERYPAEARAQHQQGKGVVAFTIARDGKVTRVWIDQSTGSSALDQASIATIRDASPVPPLPHDITGASVDFFLPISYTLNTFERLFE